MPAPPVLPGAVPQREREAQTVRLFWCLLCILVSGIYSLVCSIRVVQRASKLCLLVYKYSTKIVHVKGLCK